jgi:hypothetical protein
MSSKPIRLYFVSTTVPGAFTANCEDLALGTYVHVERAYHSNGEGWLKLADVPENGVNRRLSIPAIFFHRYAPYRRLS